MSWVYLSPHFDDAALSCGGLVWEQSRHNEQVDIWTICAAEPPSGDLSPFAQELHARWQIGQNAPAQQRSKEDILSCQYLGASYRHIPILDCIYRCHPQTAEFMYASESALNGPLHPGDDQLMQDLSEQLRMSLKSDTVVVCPLALGTHVDHQLTRQAAEEAGLIRWYYADFPYVIRDKAQLEQLEQEGWASQVFPISQDGLAAWQDSINAHRSQISTYWLDELAMRRAITEYLSWYNGIRLWRKPAA
ncbi:MAG: PIG-L family deacetylase [Anaerolineales bacterium]